MTDIKTYKISSTSEQNGISASRRGNRVSITPSAPVNSTLDIIEVGELDSGESASKGSPYNSNISCGALPSSPSGFNLSEDSPSPASPSNQISIVSVAPSPSEEEYPCDPEGGFVMAAPSGYYLLKPNYDDKALSYVQYLGTSINNQCIIEIVGNVEWIQVKDYKSNCMPSRWSYEDGVRKHAIPQDVQLWNCMPFINSTQEDYFVDFFADDFVSISHYGYNYEGTMGAGAKLGGVATAGDVCFFTKDALVAAIEGTDWELFDSPAWDFPSFLGTEGNRGIRWIDGFDKNIPCDNLVLDTVDLDNRFLQHLNHDRYCIQIVDKVEWNGELGAVCQSYAEKMAEYEFIAHTDPFTGETAEDRLATAGIPYEIMTETLASASGFEVPEGEPENAYAVDALWEAWKASEVHYDALVSVKYYQAGFGFARSDSGTWYGCAVVMTQEEDGPEEYESYKIDYQEPPYVWKTDNPEWYPVVRYRGSGIRAMCTAPQETCYLSGILRPVFEGSFLLLGEYLPVRIKDFYAYDWKLDNIYRDEEGTVHRGSEYVNTDYPHEYGRSLLSTGAFIRPVDAGNSIEFWIQRDIRTNVSPIDRKDIRVILEGVQGSTRPIPIPDPGNRDYFRESPLLGKDENEPEFPYNGAPGDCELRIGLTFIDRASRLQQGPTLNPWQNIMVGSVFYTVSGYTAVTYTMPKMLNTTAREWNEPEEEGGKWVKELYWWFKTEFWAAIIDPNGIVIARWKLKASPPDYSSNDSSVYFYKEKVYESHGGQEYTVQFEGRILPEEVKVYCTVNGTDFYLEDDGNGVFYEIPEQIDGFDTILASSEINYDAGSIHFIFGPAHPDEDTEITITAKELDADPLQPIETFQEIVQYEGEQTMYNPYQISFDGVHPLCPNLTITEDGSMAIFSCRTSWIEFSAGPRLGYGDKMELTESTYFTNKYGTSGLQIQMFDLTDIQHNGPQPLSYPLNIGDSLGDTLILN